jgi:hypothetical protein
VDCRGLGKYLRRSGSQNMFVSRPSGPSGEPGIVAGIRVSRRHEAVYV